VPSFALPRFLVNDAIRVEHARKLEKIVRESGGNVEDERARYRHAPSPMDLRGIPAVGRHVGGAIFGTQPEGALIARER
jgi:hypothetical protein